jgi:hypothetical protein
MKVAAREQVAGKPLCERNFRGLASRTAGAGSKTGKRRNVTAFGEPFNRPPPWLSGFDPGWAGTKRPVPVF